MRETDSKRIKQLQRQAVREIDRKRDKQCERRKIRETVGTRDTQLESQIQETGIREKERQAVRDTAVIEIGSKRCR